MDHKVNSAGVMDVRQWISIKNYHIGNFANFDTAQVLGLPESACVVYCGTF